VSEPVSLGWSIVELLGHRVLAGFVSEVEIAGAGFLRVDLWTEEGASRATQFVAPASIYAITPTTEAAVRERMKPRPVHRYALAAAIEPPEDPDFCRDEVEAGDDDSPF